MPAFRYDSEAEMCADFIRYVEHKGYDAYAETNGYDIFIVCPKTGLQFGIEAKQRLNAKVLLQAYVSQYQKNGPHPDFVAVLVPESKNKDLIELAKILQITVIVCRGKSVIQKSKITGEFRYGYKDKGGFKIHAFYPDFPDFSNSKYAWRNNKWFDNAPDIQMKVPDYKPDVVAGDKSPRKLSPWKVKAIKLMCILDKRGFVTSKDFKALSLNQSTFTQRGYLKKGKKRGEWVKAFPPDFRKQHPVNYDEICSDMDRWASKDDHLKNLL